MAETCRINLECVPLEAVLLAKDYCEAEHNMTVALKYSGTEAVLSLPSAEDMRLFTEELGDYVKRLAVSERTRTIKEFIIGRALYGNISRST